jgi:hypothetical protein
VPATLDAVLARSWADARAAGFLLILFMAFLVLVSQAFVFEEVFLSWVVLAIVFAAGLLVRYAELAHERFGWIVGRLAVPAILALLLAVNARATVYAIQGYFADSRVDGGNLTDVQRATAALRRYDRDLSVKVVMSMHPAWAYYAGSGYVMMPGYFQGDLTGLPTYRGLSPRIRAFVPRHPATIPDAELHADYLVYDAGAARYLPQFRSLLDSTAQVPAGLRPVYRSTTAAIFAVRRP